jgi:hypothetical protein
MRRSIPRMRTCLALCAAVVGLAGCGDGKPWVDTSLNEATVSGVVSVKGKPADGGTILFNASNSGRIVAARTAKIGPDGSYTVKTYTGINQVSFDGDVTAKNRGVGLVKEAVDVAPGENKADFDLLGAGGGKKPLYPIEGKVGKKTGKRN